MRVFCLDGLYLRARLLVLWAEGRIFGVEDLVFRLGFL